MYITTAFWRPEDHEFDILDHQPGILRDGFHQPVGDIVESIALKLKRT